MNVIESKSLEKPVAWKPRSKRLPSSQCSLWCLLLWDHSNNDVWLQTHLVHFGFTFGFLGVCGLRMVASNLKEKQITSTPILWFTSTVAPHVHLTCRELSYLAFQQARRSNDFDATDLAETVWSHTFFLQEILQYKYKQQELTATCICAQ